MKRLSVPIEAQKRSGFCKCGCGRKTPISQRTSGPKGLYKGWPTNYCVGHKRKIFRVSPRRLQVPASVQSRSGFCECGCGEQLQRTKTTNSRLSLYEGSYPRFKTGHSIRLHNPIPRLVVPDEIRNRSGLCECGCGKDTGIAKNTNPKAAYYSGYPYRFIPGHHQVAVFPKGAKNWAWKGGRWTDGKGYVWVYMPDHPRATRKYFPEHRLVMEKEHGRFLTSTEHVHHINGDPGDNRPENLVVLEKIAHHRLHSLSGHPIGQKRDLRPI